MPKQLTFEFDQNFQDISPQKVARPKGYSGLYGFHKYWGKKPCEPLALIIEQLTQEGDIILDPFVGSGTSARESLLRNRRFIGFDINPVAIELTNLMVSPPDYFVINDAFKSLEKTVKNSINETYKLQDGRIASHYLWKQDVLNQVWLRGGPKNSRVELSPTAEDIDLAQKFTPYTTQQIRNLRFFSNGRINANPTLSIADLMTGRAQYNIDLLLTHIKTLPQDSQRAIYLCLTAASGQMSKLVFAVTNRGKNTGNISKKVEVGSWVIGYWRPELHFEVNVWNCFERRVSKLLKAISDYDPLQKTNICDSLEQFYQNRSDCCILYGPCQDEIEKIPKKSVNLILTDPPHSDRIPYLELSELWNSILGIEPIFESEIIISNAKERQKTPDLYLSTMIDFLAKCSTVMRDDAFLVLLYNSRQSDRWGFIQPFLDGSETSAGLQYLGQFPCNYSAGSVVQDTRKGGLKHDVALIFGKSKSDLSKIADLKNIPGWSDTFRDE